MEGKSFEKTQKWGRRYTILMMILCDVRLVIDDKKMEEEGEGDVGKSQTDWREIGWRKWEGSNNQHYRGGGGRGKGGLAQIKVLGKEEGEVK